MQTWVQKKTVGMASYRLHVDVYKVLSVFIFCAFVGWIYETLVVLILQRRFGERGYFFVLQPLSFYLPMLQSAPVLRAIPLVVGLPLIEMYGFGGTLMIFVFRKLECHPVVLFFSGMGILSLFELLGSYFCTEILHQTLWDYSNHPLDFEGRVSIVSALCWGILSVLSVKLLAPFLDGLYQKEKHLKHFKVAVIFLVGYSFLCALAKYWIFPGVLVEA